MLICMLYDHDKYVVFRGCATTMGIIIINETFKFQNHKLLSCNIYIFNSRSVELANEMYKKNLYGVLL